MSEIEYSLREVWKDTFLQILSTIINPKSSPQQHIVLLVSTANVRETFTSFHQIYKDHHLQFHIMLSSGHFFGFSFLFYQ